MIVTQIYSFQTTHVIYLLLFRYQDGILPNLNDDQRNCGITISSIMDRHNGEWKCKLGVINDVRESSRIL